MESDAQMSLKCLTRLRRGLHMHHASIVMPRTNSPVGFKALRSRLTLHTAFSGQHSSHDEDTTFLQQARFLVVTVEGRVSGRETGARSATHAS